MAANEPLHYLIKRFNNKISKGESVLLEADVFVYVCNELKKIFKEKYYSYFRLMNFNLLMEETMLEENLMSLIIKDILSTEEYTLKGISCYTDIHEDIILDLASGLNKAPSAICFRKIIELHKTVKPELYKNISKKMTSEYLATDD